MPYIHQYQRDDFDPLISDIVKHTVNHAGQSQQYAGFVNYVITRLLWGLCCIYDGECSPPKGEYDYALLNELVGALESAKAEFQRRIVGPYEDMKRLTNGDIIQRETTQDDPGSTTILA